MASLNIGFKGVFSFDILLKGNGVFRILRRPRCPFFGYQRKALIQKDPDENTVKKKKNKRKRKRK